MREKPNEEGIFIGAIVVLKVIAVITGASGLAFAIGYFLVGGH
jgi:hypothetical protein